MPSTYSWVLVMETGFLRGEWRLSNVDLFRNVKHLLRNLSYEILRNWQPLHCRGTRPKQWIGRLIPKGRLAKNVRHWWWLRLVLYELHVQINCNMNNLMRYLKTIQHMRWSEGYRCMQSNRTSKEKLLLLFFFVGSGGHSSSSLPVYAVMACESCTDEFLRKKHTCENTDRQQNHTRR